MKTLLRQNIAGLDLPVISVRTVVVGSGAAGLNCCVRLYRELEARGDAHPEARLALVTQGLGLGTSHNAGSDKQTYYKPETGADTRDSAADFADTLSAGGAMHADLARVEAQNALRCFYRLVDLGVPFPHTAEGAFVGYKTDYDPRRRATSAGPWTSRDMVKVLLRELRRFGIPVFERYHAAAVVTDDDGACGLLCVDAAQETAPNHGLVLFRCRNLVFAGGGPGALFESSVYPEGQMGPYAQLLESGVRAVNLTEMQFGIASLRPRWNLSGTYQQAIPRYFSTAPDGSDERDFLNPYFASLSGLASAIFLKGYQWPLDPGKLPGSSLIDVLVYDETVNRRRRVFLDFRKNPRAVDRDTFAVAALEDEARAYLEQSGAVQNRPIERLAHLNQPGIDLFAAKGRDLRTEPLEIAVCAQHCNGGFAVDTWWESNLPHLFVIGELAGTHGVTRPGGAALNAGQVGGLRAAQRIAHVYGGDPPAMDRFTACAAGTVRRTAAFAAAVRAAPETAPSAERLRRTVQRRMSRCAGAVREPAAVNAAWQEAREAFRNRPAVCSQGAPGYLRALEARELDLAQRAFLEAVRHYLASDGGSRGSALVLAPEGRPPHPDLPDTWRFKPENTALRRLVQTLQYDRATDAFHCALEPVRTPPEPEAPWFETVWTRFRHGDVFLST
ncbi:MAG: FAD-binding protein [Lentisphaerae bacterium]|nr:FAD-binding protein [Lentisphaerota bacterium]